MLMHQAGHLDHDANCRSLELFAREVMPEFVEDEDRREAAKAERLAPAIDAALRRKTYLPELAEIPTCGGLRPFQPSPDGRRLRHRGDLVGDRRGRSGSADRAASGRQARYCFGSARSRPPRARYCPMNANRGIQRRPHHRRIRPV